MDARQGMRIDEMRPDEIRLEKTEKARAVLARTSADRVKVAERRILILADGQRTLADITAALGEASAATVQGLIDREYLVATHVPPPEPEPEEPDQIRRIGHLLRGASQIMRALPEAESPPPARRRAAPAEAAVRSSRTTRQSLQSRPPPPRTIIAAKTHAIELLAEHPDPAVAARMDIVRRARGEYNVATAILEALHVLQASGDDAGFADALRMLDPLMPEDYLPSLRAIARPARDDDAGT